jgi:hypothetical protein
METYSWWWFVLSPSECAWDWCAGGSMSMGWQWFVGLLVCLRWYVNVVLGCFSPVLVLPLQSDSDWDFSLAVDGPEGRLWSVSLGSSNYYVRWFLISCASSLFTSWTRHKMYALLNFHQNCFQHARWFSFDTSEYIPWDIHNYFPTMYIHTYTEAPFSLTCQQCTHLIALRWKIEMGQDTISIIMAEVSLPMHRACCADFGQLTRWEFSAALSFHANWSATDCRQPACEGCHPPKMRERNSSSRSPVAVNNWLVLETRLQK